jgi:hypothetical protein
MMANEAKWGRFAGEMRRFDGGERGVDEGLRSMEGQRRRRWRRRQAAKGFAWSITRALGVVLRGFSKVFLGVVLK